MAQVPFLNVLLESLSKESRHLRRVAGPLFLPATLEGEGELRLPRETLRKCSNPGGKEVFNTSKAFIKCEANIN